MNSQTSGNESFDTYALTAPTYDQVADEYQQIHEQLGADDSADGCAAAVQQWEMVRRRLSEWASLTEIRFHQDTRDEQFKAAKQQCDELKPRLTELEVAMKRRLIEPPCCDAVADRWGSHVLELWKCDIASFDPVIQEDLVQESKLVSDYTELLASAKFDYRGESHTLSELRKYAEDPQRDVRHETAQLRSDWFGDHREQLDGLYAELVALRDGMARKMDYDNYVGLGYRLMQRVDYDQSDVEAFRAQVREEVVPLCAELKKRQSAQLGLDPLMAWDEALHDLRGNPAPQGDHDWMIDQAATMFAQVGGGLDEFFAAMRRRSLLDLKSRPGKAGGGFCDGLPEFGMPFIFANFNGTKGDVEVFTHEMGHAYQNYSSRHQPLCDYRWPTSEACEIHSMGLEFLTWPQMELFFGEAAERFRTIHLSGSIVFIPYGVAVDHFQHLVYERPDATRDERSEMWLEMERIYMPWRQWGDLANEASGRFWQGQLHIYVHPFYYIDYTLALTCALQLWTLAREDWQEAMQRYVQLCRRGGEAPFQQLVASAGLRSPFADGCLTDVVDAARRALEIA